MSLGRPVETGEPLSGVNVDVVDATGTADPTANPDLAGECPGWPGQVFRTQYSSDEEGSLSVEDTVDGELTLKSARIGDRLRFLELSEVVRDCDERGEVASAEATQAKVSRLAEREKGRNEPYDCSSPSQTCCCGSCRALRLP